VNTLGDAAGEVGEEKCKKNVEGKAGERLWHQGEKGGDSNASEALSNWLSEFGKTDNLDPWNSGGERPWEKCGEEKRS